MEMFRFIKICLVIILGYVGIKMLLSPWLATRDMDVPAWFSLLIICGVLSAGVLASVVLPRPPEPQDQHE